jgi:hypothetical protein
MTVILSSERVKSKSKWLLECLNLALHYKLTYSVYILKPYNARDYIWISTDDSSWWHDTKSDMYFYSFVINWWKKAKILKTQLRLIRDHIYIHIHISLFFYKILWHNLLFYFMLQPVFPIWYIFRPYKGNRHL